MNVGGKKKGSLYILGYVSELVIKIWQSEKKKKKSKSGEFGPGRNHNFQVQISPKKTKH